ncbi:MAG: endolytic transglycosylase MltG [Candidatus Paceibacterota bacterium]
MQNLNYQKPKSKISFHQKIVIFLGLLFLVVVLALSVLFTAPSNFPKGEIIEIEKGSSLMKVSEMLKEKGVIKFPRILDAFVIVFGGDKSIVAGDYSFERPITVFEVAHRIINGIHGIDSVRISIPEGATREEMAEIYHEKLLNFSEEDFLFLTKDLEGYLFPDTYIFFVTAEAPDVVDRMLVNFDSKIAPLLSDIDKSGKTLSEIVTMASIIQKEAYNIYSEQQTISGILWKRIDKKMRLQVDATLKYITGKPSSKLTLDDLAMEHDYNTYKNYGLPPGPIGSPSIKAIRAALYPISSPYFFYLHSNSGQVYYAVDHAGHIQNKNNYLR